jgi:hypothetical protein
VAAAGVTGSDDGGAGGNKGTLRVTIEAEAGASEAEVRRNMDRMLALIARYNEFADTLPPLRGATPPKFRKALTVLALVQLLFPLLADDDLALVLELLPEGLPAKYYDDTLRGMLAAVVATLRTVNPRIGNLEIEKWLTEETERRALDFGVDNVMRWFSDCDLTARRAGVPQPAGFKNRNVTQAMLDAFNSFRPAEGQSLTEAEARQWTKSILDTAVAMKPRALTRQIPRRRN